MSGMVYGYARVSTRQQDLSRQLDLLEKYNCHKIYTEKISGTQANRPELIKLKAREATGSNHHRKLFPVLAAVPKT